MGEFAAASSSFLAGGGRDTSRTCGQKDVAVSPGPKVVTGKLTQSAEGNDRLAGATVHPAHPTGVAVQMVMEGGKHQ